MNKFEKHIKEKFEQRELTPSPRAWKKIEAGLDGQLKKPKSKKYGYAIAAAFIGLILSVILFSSEKSETATPEIVDVENNAGVPNSLNEIDAPQEKVEPMLVEKEPIKIGPKDHSIAIRQEQNPKANSVALEEDRPEIAIEPQPLEGQAVFINQKVDEVFAQVTFLESQNIQVTEAEVDSLLRAAQRDILVEKVFDGDGSVDAMALLTEVEDELDQSFRDQIFEALKDGYTKLRTAVADRNN